MSDTQYPLPQAMIDETVGDFQLVVFYAEHEGSPQYNVTVKHKDGASRSGWVRSGWAPIFGIDAEDMFFINEMAEKFCIEMEKEFES